MKKILLLIAGVGYQPIEYGTPKQLFLDAGFLVTTASDIPGVAQASDGTTTTVDLLLDDVEVEEYDALFLIGGPGALEHLDVQETHKICNEAMLHGILYGAICIAPRILAKAHVLVGKKATGWNGDTALQEIFAQHNVVYEDRPVVRDGNVITASGPGAAEAFGRAIIELLLEG